MTSPFQSIYTFFVRPWFFCKIKGYQFGINYYPFHRPCLFLNIFLCCLPNATYLISITCISMLAELPLTATL